MHMADALISPAVGGALWAVTGGVSATCARKLKTSMRGDLIPMMGVLGAFIFTAQMINFSIPGTGSSGHLGGGLMLAVLLGPYAAFLVIASVLAVQAFFFADGGLLALGCNIFNLGFFPAFVAYPVCYRWLARDAQGGVRLWGASVLAAVVGLQLGAFSVVLETWASGVSGLPFGTFLLLMQPIHLAIGVVEGMATAAAVSFVARARPESLAPMRVSPNASASLRSVLTGVLLATCALGGAFSWLASTRPDGLEWAIAKVSGKEEVAGNEGNLHRRLAALQEKTAILPDYGFKAGAGRAAPEEATDSVHDAPASEAWPAVDAGTSVAGLVGGAVTLVLACLVGFAVNARQRAV